MILAPFFYRLPLIGGWLRRRTVKRLTRHLEDDWFSRGDIHDVED